VRRLFLAALATLSLAATIGLPASASAAEPTRVAIIVGPVGALTPTYLALAELAAAEAERHGSVVARAYSPHATPANVLAAVENANIVIYFGHGYGHPSPYGPLDTSRQNGWGLQGPLAHGTHADGLNGELAYYGEDWIVANARPAPGFVMIYSNVCYAPGASEGGFAPATEGDALQRVAHYSRKVFRMGGSAYYAIDFDRGAADLVGRILADRQRSYGSVFASDHRFVPSALRAYGHPMSAGQQVWLHRTKYTDGPPNYWYAFAGDPDLAPTRAWDAVAPSATLVGAPSDLAPASPLRVAFTEPVVGLNQGEWVLTDAAGRAVGLTATLDTVSNEVTLTSETPLAMSARYRLEVRGDATDTAGNALPTTSWDLATRLDEDPLVRALPVMLEAGEHRLVRFDDAWRVAEEMTITVGDERWLSAARRARMPDSPGRWLLLEGDGFDGWWVAESSSAHASGALDIASFMPETTVELPEGIHRLYGWDAGAMRPDGEVSVRSSRHVEVDRRAVVDGVLSVRAAVDEAGIGGRWLAIEPAMAPDETLARRILGDHELQADASLALGPGAWTLFRFDERGAVTERRQAEGRGDGDDLVVRRILEVGEARFFVVSGGELDGWAVREDERHTVSTALETASAE
jgi:hypothetical protein